MLIRLAVRTGLEPATPGVTGRYSNRLNYRTNIFYELFFCAIISELRCKSSAFFYSCNRCCKKKCKKNMAFALIVLKSE